MPLVLVGREVATIIQPGTTCLWAPKMGHQRRVAPSACIFGFFHVLCLNKHKSWSSNMVCLTASLPVDFSLSFSLDVTCHVGLCNAKPF